MAKYPVCRKCGITLQASEITNGVCVNCAKQKGSVQMLRRIVNSRNLLIIICLFVGTLLALALCKPAHAQIDLPLTPEFEVTVQWGDATRVLATTFSRPEQNVYVTVTMYNNTQRGEVYFADSNDGLTVPYQKGGPDEPRSFIFEESTGKLSGSYWDRNICVVGPYLRVTRYTNESSGAEIRNITDQNLYVRDYANDTGNWDQILPGNQFFYGGGMTRNISIKLEPKAEAPECASLYWYWEDEVDAVEVGVGNSIGTISNSYVEVPIWVNTDVSNLGINSFLFTVTTESNIVQPVYVRTDGTRADQFGFTVQNVVVDQHQMIVDGYSAQTLAGQGILVWIGFKVNAIPGETPVNLEGFQFNEGAPAANVTSAMITIYPLYVTGGAQYFYDGVPVDGVELNLVGQQDVISDTTDANGEFALPVPHMSYVWDLTATKQGDIRDSITPYDAYLVAQCPLGIRVCNPASDVTGNGTIGPLDAAEIAKKSVGLPAVEGVGKWISNPESYHFEPLLDSAQVYFIMSLAGDESGSWAYSQSASTADVQQANVETSVENNIVNLTISTGNPIGALRLDLNIGEGAKLITVASDSFDTFPNFSTGAIALVAKKDAVSTAKIRLEFQVDHKTTVKLPTLLINENQYTSDLVVHLPADEMPILGKEVRLPFACKQ